MPRPHKVNIKERLASLLAEHVDKDLGITNRFIQDACLSLCPQIARKKRGKERKKVFFSGVYTSQSLQSAPRKGRGKSGATYIVNIIDPANSQTGHFVVIYKRKGSSTATYLDSLGKPCQDDNVLQFLSKINVNDYEYICEPIQHSKSSACGLYSLLYALAIECETNVQDEFDFHPPLSTSTKGGVEGRKENDKRCARYIENILTTYELSG